MHQKKKRKHCVPGCKSWLFLFERLHVLLRSCQILLLLFLQLVLNIIVKGEFVWGSSETGIIFETRDALDGF